MMKISSGSIWFAKRILPPIWFGLVALFAVFAAIDAKATEDWLFVALPLLMLPVGIIAMKKLVWTLVDEVYDGGEYLLVRNRGEEDRIPLSNIINVGATTAGGSSPVTLRLAAPGKFGREITFLPLGSSRLRPFAKNAIVEDLIDRVHQARTKGHSR